MFHKLTKSPKIKLETFAIFCLEHIFLPHFTLWTISDIPSANFSFEALPKTKTMYRGLNLNERFVLGDIKVVYVDKYYLKFLLCIQITYLKKGMKRKFKQYDKNITFIVNFLLT